ncbi:MAG TPA: hypothetical protein VMV79_06310, partial [Alphaproteobacteria bacterium]|nr:hypothetical protein [Alphaproteobacteria bacterium]
HIGFTQDYTRNGASGIVLRSVPPGMPAQNSVPVAPGVHFTPATNGRPDWLTTELGNRDAGGMRIETHFINGKAFTDIKVRGNGGQIMGPAIASGGPEVLLALQDELKKNHGDVQATSSALSTKAGQAAFKKEAAAIKAHPDKAAAPATAKSEAGAPAQGAAQPHNPATPAPAPEAAGKKPEARKGSAAKPTRRTHAGHVLRGENSKAAAGRIVIEHPGPNSAAEKLNTYYDEHNPTGNAATNPDHFDPSRALTASQYKAAMAIRLKTSW